MLRHALRAGGIAFMRYLRILAACLAPIAVLTPHVRAQADKDLDGLRAEFKAHYRASQYDRAETTGREMLALAETSLASQPAKHAELLAEVGAMHYKRRHYQQAQSCYQRSLELRERALGPDHPDVASSLNGLGAACMRLGQWDAAEPLLKRALQIREQKLGPEHPKVAQTLGNLGAVYKDQGKYHAAEPVLKRAVELRRKLAGEDSPLLASVLDDLGNVYRQQGRHPEAESLFRQALSIQEKHYGSESTQVARHVHNLAALWYDMGRYRDAEPGFRRGLAIYERTYGPEHPLVAGSLQALAALCSATGRYAEAEPLARRSLAIREKLLGPEHRDLILSLNSMALACASQGHYADAELLHQRELAICEKCLGPEHPHAAMSLHNLARVYRIENRFAEGEPLARRALAVYEKVHGPDHPRVATSLALVAQVLVDQERYAEAEPLRQRALQIYETVYGKDHGFVAQMLSGLANLYRQQGRLAEAEPLYERALALREKSFGPEHPLTAASLADLAELYHDQLRCAEAVPLMDRAILIQDRARVSPGVRFDRYHLRARISWALGRRKEAVLDLRHALDLAEQQRAESGGAEQERAEHYGKFAPAFERMLQWQLELSGCDEALEAMERSRARSLLDEMNLCGADLDAGRPALEREQLRQQEAELRTRVATLQRELDDLTDQAAPPADPSPDGRRAALEAALADARGKLYEHYRQQRSTSPVYRNLLSVGVGPPRLSQLQRQLLADQGLLLAYLFGEEGGYLLVVRPESARLVGLTVPEPAAQKLGTEAGPLTAPRLKSILVNEHRTGVLQLLADPNRADAAVPSLAVLWTLLVPEAERQLLVGGRAKRLIVIPDGPLALLPLETLVVEPGDNPRYLLDVGPPVLYGPSAAVLYNLSQRRAATAPSAREPVLTLGNPSYRPLPAADAENAGGAEDQLAANSRYGSLGGKLTPLPYSGWESDWVRDIFAKAGVPSAHLAQDDATQAHLRSEINGRRIVHLACHGLADQAYGNFYGALALTPGRTSDDDAGDDGFLTLAEIYELDLKGCELVIVSACQTNYGPQQQGEGVWSLSRGFLVAGARRVVASNWLVDDEATASLVSAFCTPIARDEKEGKPVDYADHLQRAKRWLHDQEKWSSPFYWGTFVLMGPD